MIHIQKDRMGIRSDKGIVFRDLFFDKIFVFLQSVIIFQPDLLYILQQKTKHCRCKDTADPPFFVFFFCGIQDL